MNRRSFVKKLGLLCLVPFVPTVFLSEPIPIDAPTEKFASSGSWYATEEMLGDGGYAVPKEFSKMILEQLHSGGEPVIFKGKPVTIRMGK